MEGRELNFVPHYGGKRGSYNRGPTMEVGKGKITGLTTEGEEVAKIGV